MSFCLQLRLLLWKNFILRKRNKWRSITEILWPLIMIFFVVLLHKIGEKHNLPNCHFKSKAMPAAGGVLFLQTLFCTLNNTCDTQENATCPCFNSSLVSDLGDALLEKFNLTFIKDDIYLLEEESERWSSNNWIKDVLIVESMIEAIKKNSNKESEDPDSLDDLMILSEAKEKIYYSGILKSLQNVFIDEEQNDISKLHVIDYLFCGPNVPKVISQIRSLMETGKKRNLEIDKTPNAEGSEYDFEKSEWENDTTVFCNNFMDELESTYYTRILFRLFKPLIRGKVIYTPNAPVINRIMKRINNTLSGVQKMIHLIKKNIPDKKTNGELRFEDIVDKLKNNDFMLEKIIKSEIGEKIIKYFKNDFQQFMDSKTRFNFFFNHLDHLKGTWKKIYKASKNESNFSILLKYLECFDPDRIIPLSNEQIAIKEALYWLNKGRLWGLIVFDNISSESENLPPSLTYKIRTGIERTPDTNHLQDRIYVPRVRRNIIYDLREITGGFAYLQNLLESELIREYTKRKYVPGIYLKQMPFPCHIQDSFRYVITRTFPMFMVIAWIFIFCMVSKRIVVEKEVLFKGTLKVFGVTNTLHWISWFIDSFTPLIFITIIMSVILVEGGLIPNSNVFVIWIFLTAFTLPTITLSFLISTFFLKSSRAMAVSGLIYFLLYLPYPPIQNFGDAMDPDLKIIACLISNVGFGLGCTWVAHMEEIGIGAQFDKMNYSPVPGNPITMWLIIEMFFVDSILYFLLAIYFDNIFEGTDHVRLPWYYCFTLSYWKKNRAHSQRNYEYSQEQEKDPRYFEEEPEGFRVGIEVLNLSKEFGRGRKKKKVVKNLSINFYEDQITSFLGSNGAGKTTTISMMIGLLPITKGTIRIYGVDIKNYSVNTNKDIGICRQENVLLDDLTVVEHFKLFARLKNRSLPEVESDIKELVESLQLGHRAQQPVKILSGGMKRKVCVAMAFIGGCKTVFLDEPTAGVDPLARRSIWELLIKYKKGRTIVLTTHFLDEADVLGDRIAIIASGELQCCGSSLFLKSNFGKGYYLTIESSMRSQKKTKILKSNTENETFSDQVNELNTLIKNITPTVKFLEQVGSEIVFILPSRISSDEINNIFKTLNNNKTKLNIISFGINDTSLEEICIKILLEAEKKYDEENNSGEKNLKDENLPFNEAQTQENESPSKKNEKLSKMVILKEHFIALIIKRFLHYKRNYKFMLIEMLLPIIFLIIALALARALPKVTEMPPLIIDMSSYDSSSIFYTNEFSENPLISAYEQVLLSPYGLGTKCVLHPEECSLESIPKGSLINFNETTEASNNCSCSNGFFECFNEEKLEKPPNSKTSEGFNLFNLTGLNWENWLLTTEFQYSSQRFGGINLGYLAPLTGISVEEFLNLFMFEKYIKLLDYFPVEDEQKLSDPKNLTNIIMNMSCNESFGKELFENRDFVDNIVIWFNNRGWVSSLAMMNGVTNLVLRASLSNSTNSSEYSIRLINHPLPITRRQLEDQIELETNVALICALSAIWALSFIPAMYAVYLVEEKASGLKNLQIVSGLNKSVYWFTNFIWNLISYSIIIMAVIFVYFMFDVQAFIGKDVIASFIVLLYSYGFANITFVYAISFGFSVASAAFVFIACWNIFSGVITLLLTYTLNLVRSEENSYYLESIFIIFPQFGFGKSLVNMALDGIRRESLENFGVSAVNKSFSWETTTKYIVVMIINGVLFFIITFILEYQIVQKLFSNKFVKKLFYKKRDSPNPATPNNEDDDVRIERERVESGSAKNDADILIINNLTKIYPRMKFPAVDHICLGIKSGECFGLLGLNGAGKTTVFKMLTGCISPTEGDATIGGFSIKTFQSKTKFLIGYCPQIDALDPYLTAEEHLSFFCRIRGVYGRAKKIEVSSKIQRLGLMNHKHKIIKKLSGGNKRKVNAGIALICNPNVVLLDEPTSGMDILSKRFLWNCLHNVLLEGQCIILTSHSMEECQVLCTLLSIMVNGKFSCFGSCQHLKNKFNQGYIVLISLFSIENSAKVIELIQKNFPQAILMYAHYKQLRFKMEPSISIGDVFKVLNKAKNDRLIQTYSISQTTLENIFLKLAGDAEAPKHPEPKSNCFKKLCRSKT